ncbi:zinc-ribbon domain-containing protein [Butyrivibrio proteoclasticus]|uniref:zinc-ribbon domain-containing protein n=1 Tax=Butyrivibrio proteoclasticus TaxID=43305 RepID=UPI00047CACA6|nr:zinc-ribbon domain-containing protein [Butyrivibrio proteoclasticus]
MICKKCGSEVAEGQRFCGNCGADVFAAEEPVVETVAEEPVVDATEEVSAPAEEVASDNAEAVPAAEENNSSSDETVEQTVETPANEQAQPVAGANPVNSFGGMNQGGFQNSMNQNGGFQGGMNQNGGFQGNMNQGGFQDNMNQGGFQGNMNQGGFQGGMNQNGFQGNMNQGGFQGGMNQGGFQGGMNQGGFQGGMNQGGMYQGQPGKKPLNKKTLFMIIGGAAAALVALIVIILLIKGASGSLASTGKDRTTYDGPTISHVNGYLINSDGRTNDQFEDGYMLDYYFYTDRFNSSGIVKDDKTVYYVDADLNVTKIAKGVKFVQLCADGGFVYYVSVNDKGDDTLYVYDTEKAKETVIAKNVYSGSVAVSPNGKRVAYSRKEGKRKYVSCFADQLGHEKVINKKAEYYENFYAISNDTSSYVYTSYTKKDNNTYYVHNNKKIKINNGSSYFNRFYVNYDHTEIVFGTDSGDTEYYAVGMDSAAELFDNDPDYVLSRAPICETGNYGRIICADTLKTSLFAPSHEKVYAITDDGKQGVLVSKNFDMVIFGLVDDEFNVVSVDGEDIDRYIMINGDADKTNVYSGDDEIQVLVGNEDLSEIYFVEDSVIYSLEDFHSDEFYNPSDDYYYISVYSFGYCEETGNIYFDSYDGVIELDRGGDTDVIGDSMNGVGYVNYDFYYIIDDELHYYFGEREVVIDL